MRITSFIQYISAVLSCLVLSVSCEDSKESVPVIPPYEVAAKWADMSLYITQYTPANSPTYASRCFGYIGLVMYESVTHGDSSYQSLAGQLNELTSLPIPEVGENYNWKAALNAGQAEILRSIYNQTSDENKLRIDSLEDYIHQSLQTEGIEKKLIEKSANYGRSIAQAIFKWSKTDGGHRAYLYNFDKEWKHPEFSGSWKPPLFAQSFSHHPLHPHWGDNRTFAPTNQELPIPDMIPVDTTEGSTYYNEFVAVYDADRELTQEQKEVALWWGDDPDDTFTPPGHSYYIATLVIRAKQPTLVESAATYAQVGMSVADAFINCWKWKYHHFTERANTFIPTHIDQTWESFWPDPPFPSFPSGHAIQASAAATALIHLYGEKFSFIDSSHVERERDEVRDVDFNPRSFTTFWGVAEETAMSRFYGGIHIPHDNKVGLEEGRKIATNVAQLNWKQ